MMDMCGSNGFAQAFILTGDTSIKIVEKLKQQHGFRVTISVIIYSVIVKPSVLITI